MRTIKYALAILVCAFAAGCYTQSQVYSDKLNDVDLSHYSTYAWLPTTGDSMSLMNNQILQSNLMSEIDEQLQMRGYGPDAENPDLLILMHVYFSEETDVYRDPVYASYDYVYPVYTVNYPYYYVAYDRVTYIEGYTIDSVNYTQGSVVVDVIEAKSSKLLWRGWSERVVDQENYKKNLSKDIEAIFREYPVKPVEQGYSVR